MSKDLKDTKKKPDTSSGKRLPGLAKDKIAEPEPVPEPTEQNVVHIETDGFGKFEFIDGTIYEGQWKLINGVKMRHGEGVLRHAGSSSESGEEYRGTWAEDLQNGYGVYRYINGSVYSGEWVNGKQEGKGLFEFPDGSKYEGEWKDHKMHGDGSFTDLNGNKWEGIFVDGIYQSKIQKQLKYEKQLRILENQILASAKEFFTKFEQVFAETDKKKWKENLTPLFALIDDTKAYVREPYPKYEERPADKWNSAFTFIQQYTMANALRAPEQAKFINPENVLLPQFNGFGQVVEFERVADDRTVKVALCNTAQDTWVPVFFFDTVPPKDK